MKKTEIYKAIDAEIAWCEEAKNRTMPEDYIEGFVKGLKQAKRIVKLLPLE